MSFSNQQRQHPVLRVIRSILLLIVCLLRNLPFFLAESPRTPLRVLCIIAFDWIYRLRNGSRLSTGTRKILATLLDLGASANAKLDKKSYSHKEYCRMLKLLTKSKSGEITIRYLKRLNEIEQKRPQIDVISFDYREVVLYREAVIRLLIGVIATTTEVTQSVEQGINATSFDADLNLLFRIAMLCQIIDDAMDYSSDFNSSLPSFFTASKSLSDAIELTRFHCRDYSNQSSVTNTCKNFPLRVALMLVSAYATFTIDFSRWTQRPRRIECNSTGGLVDSERSTTPSTH